MVGIRIVVERALRRPFLGPGLELGHVRIGREVVPTARRDEFFDGRRLRQMGEQALGRLLVLAEAPQAPEIRQERREPPLWAGGEAMGPALFGDLWCVPLGDRPGAWRVQDECALAGDQNFVVGGVVPRRCIGRQERNELLVVFERLADGIGLHRDVALGIYELRAERLEYGTGRINAVGSLTEAYTEREPTFLAGFRGFQKRVQCP